jgi:hypothetical protein
VILEEKELYGQGICVHCTGIGDAHKLHCKTLRLEKGWILRIPFDFSDDPFEAEWEKAHVR